MNLTIRTSHKKSEKICLIGNLNIDLIIRNISTFPAWGQEVIGDGYSIVSSGQSAYTAFALRKLNVPVSIVGNVGNDIYGKKILTDLSNADINIESVETSVDGKTGITIAIVRPDGERAFISDPSCLSEFTKELILKYEAEIIESEIVCFVGSFFLPGLPIKDTVHLLEKMKLQNKTTFLDTGWDPYNWSKETISTLRQGLRFVDYFIPNLDEAFAITGQKDAEKALRSLISDGAKNVVIKMGANGSISEVIDHIEHVPAYNVQVVDAVGAGDVFNAGFLFGTLQDWPISARMNFGSMLSALYISKQEDRFPALEDVVKTLNEWDSNQFHFKVD